MSRSHTPNGDYGSRLTRAEAQIVELRKGQEVIFSKLDTIASAVHDLHAKSGPPMPVMLDMGIKVAGLFAAVVAGILYLAATSSASAVSDLDKRLARVELVLSMATVRRVPARPSAWVPGLASR